MDAQGKRLQVGQILGERYRIISEAITRDMGTEYKAYDTQFDRLVVIVLLDERFGSGPEVIDRLFKAQQTLADLTEPALSPVEQIGVMDRQLYLVRGHADGRTLAHLLQQYGPLDLRRTLEIVTPLCDALASAHRRGLVHGSLSTASVYVADDGQVTVTDTGLLPALRDPALPGQPWGRFPYVSPEQAAGADAHPSSDVYVVGLLIYEMLAGRPPFRSNDEAVLVMQHLRYDPPSLQVLAPGVPLPLIQIVNKALAKEPAARYRHAGQLAHILRSQLVSQAAIGPSVTATPVQAAAATPMVVPPPPPSASAASAGGAYQGAVAGVGYQVDESEGVDWLMIGLLIAALIAVLGLIPLWQSVYRRYAVPAVVPTPSSSDPAGVDGAWCLSWCVGRAVQPEGRSQVDDSRSVRHAAAIPMVMRGFGVDLLSTWLRSGATDCFDRLSNLGVQITVFGATCIKL